MYCCIFSYNTYYVDNYCSVHGRGAVALLLDNSGFSANNFRVVFLMAEK